MKFHDEKLVNVISYRASNLLLRHRHIGLTLGLVCHPSGNFVELLEFNGGAVEGAVEGAVDKGFEVRAEGA